MLGAAFLGEYEITSGVGFSCGLPESATISGKIKAHSCSSISCERRSVFSDSGQAIAARVFAPVTHPDHSLTCRHRPGSGYRLESVSAGQSCSGRPATRALAPQRVARAWRPERHNESAMEPWEYAPRRTPASALRAHASVTLSLFQQARARNGASPRSGLGMSARDHAKPASARCARESGPAHVTWQLDRQSGSRRGFDTDRAAPRRPRR
jgi:hypothetical protein